MRNYLVVAALIVLLSVSAPTAVYSAGITCESGSNGDRYCEAFPYDPSAEYVWDTAGDAFLIGSFANAATVNCYGPTAQVLVEVIRSTGSTFHSKFCY